MKTIIPPCGQPETLLWHHCAEQHLLCHYWILGTTPAQEEQEYAAYGFMLWGNSNYAYNQCTMGYTASADITPMVYSSAQMVLPILVDRLQPESHDEEQPCIKTCCFGNVYNNHNVKTLATALRQEEAATVLFYPDSENVMAVPGTWLTVQSMPMEEDWLINHPYGIIWMTLRKALYDAYSKIIKFRLANPAIFNNTTPYVKF